MSVQKLWKLARVLALNTGCARLRDIVLDLKFVAGPGASAPSSPLRGLWKVGVGRHDEGRVPLGANDRDAANLLRDGLILAFLATYPLRANNFAPSISAARSARRTALGGSCWTKKKPGTAAPHGRGQKRRTSPRPSFSMASRALPTRTTTARERFRGASI